MWFNLEGTLFPELVVYSRRKLYYYNFFFKFDIVLIIPSWFLELRQDFPHW